jgi:ubiquinone/menaquinone biosynthesis C-methylase UbiE
MTGDTGVGALPSAVVKQCCAAAYGSDWASLLLGDSFHPGGTRLTDRLGELLDLRPGMLVLDVAAGRGTSALHLASARGCEVVGIDLSITNVTAATAAAAEHGLHGRVRFLDGDAERLPVEAAGVDAVLCECAYCTFPDKAAAAAEFHRVLRPGGLIGISDLVRRGPLPADLQDLFAWVACVADALPVEGYIEHLAAAGIEVDHIESHDDALADMAESIRSRLLTGRVLAAAGRIDLPGVDWERASAMARSAVAAIRDGVLGYIVLRGRTSVGQVSARSEV